MDRTWMKEKITMSYEDLFNYVIQSRVLGDMLNENKLAEVGFEIPHLVYIQKNNKSPYMETEKKSKEILYTNGDATSPKGEGKKYIVHVCNDIGGWGRGFVLALSNKWDSPEKSYREWNRNGFYELPDSTKCKFELGNIQVVPVEENLSVINMIGQHGCYPTIVDGEKIQPIRYDALKKCLMKVAKLAKSTNASVHMPMIGAGLAGGDWSIIEGIINKTLIFLGVDTTVYIFDEK